MKTISKFLFILLGTFLILPFACKKDTNVTPIQVTGTVSDRDGNIYKTIRIGSQTWMAEDLKAKTYQNGDSVFYAQETKKWVVARPAYCLIDTSFSLRNILLYNWYAISDPRRLAPAGWHIPSDNEWKTLEMHLGMAASEADRMNWRGSKEGDKLKYEKATDNPLNKWSDSDVDVYKIWGNNESGFTALASGCRIFNGDYGDPGKTYVGFWWSSTEKNEQAWYRFLDANKSGVFRFYGDKRYGFSVRCIKD